MHHYKNTRKYYDCINSYNYIILPFLGTLNLATQIIW